MNALTFEIITNKVNSLISKYIIAETGEPKTLRKLISFTLWNVENNARPRRPTIAMIKANMDA